MPGSSKKKLTAPSSSSPNSTPQPKLIQDGRTIEERIAELTAKLELAKEIQNRVRLEAEEAGRMREECSGQVARVLPLIEGILKPLDSLQRSDMAQLKSMKNPPSLVKMVMAAVCVLKRIKPQEITDDHGKKVMDYWGPTQKMLADTNFLQSLKDFDKDNIPPEVMAEVRRDYVRRFEFQPNYLSKTSSAAVGLCTWVLALERYDIMAKEIAPVKTRLLEAEKILKESCPLLMAKGKEIKKLEERLARLNMEFSEGTENSQMLTPAAQTNPSQPGGGAQKDQ